MGTPFESWRRLDEGRERLLCNVLGFLLTQARPALKGQTSLFSMLSVDQPAVEAGGQELIDAGEKRLAAMDPLSPDYEYLSLLIHGDTSIMKIDAEGRVILTDNIREHTGIVGEVAFVGRGHFFQIWEPQKFAAYRVDARKRVAELRKSLTASLGSSDG